MTFNQKKSLIKQTVTYEGLGEPRHFLVGVLSWGPIMNTSGYESPRLSMRCRRQCTHHQMCLCGVHNGCTYFAGRWGNMDALIEAPHPDCNVEPSQVRGNVWQRDVP